jgi:hypothetical protein
MESGRSWEERNVRTIRVLFISCYVYKTFSLSVFCLDVACLPILK